MAKFSDESVRTALAGRKVVRVYPLPGVEGVSVGVRMLSDLELDGVRLRAQDYVKARKCELVIDPEFFDRAIQREAIAQAFVDPDKHEEPFFASPEEVAQLDAQAVRACWELFQRHQISMDPFAHCTREEVDELVELLGKSGDTEALSKLFEPSTLWSFVASMASVLRERSQTPKSATG